MHYFFIMFLMIVIHSDLDVVTQQVNWSDLRWQHKTAEKKKKEESSLSEARIHTYACLEQSPWTKQKRWMMTARSKRSNNKKKTAIYSDTSWEKTEHPC